MNRFDFTSAPISPAKYTGPLPDPRQAPEPSRGSGWLIAAAVLIVIVGMAFCGAIPPA